MDSVLTTCGYCGCGCNFYVGVEDDQITSITPKADHPVSLGMLCAKGWQGHGFVRHPDRLRFPKIRQEDGSFADASWEEAYAYIARKLKQITTAHGPESFAFFSSARCTNEENYLAAKFTRSVVGSPHIDHCARL